MTPNKILKLTPSAKNINKISHRSFKSLNETTKKEWDICSAQYEIGVHQKVSQRLIELIESQRGDDKKYGFPVDLYEHQLQSATRAYRDGANEEIIIMCLFHDGAEYLSPHNHGHCIGEILYPYLSPKGYWILSHHDIFQSYFYMHHYNKNLDEIRSKFIDYPYDNETVYFCDNYDQNNHDDHDQDSNDDDDMENVNDDNNGIPIHCDSDTD